MNIFYGILMGAWLFLGVAAIWLELSYDWSEDD